MDESQTISTDHSIHWPSHSRTEVKLSPWTIPFTYHSIHGPNSNYLHIPFYGPKSSYLHGLFHSRTIPFMDHLQIKVRKTAKTRKWYNQVPHLTQDTTWESDKNEINITSKSQEVSLFPAGDHKAAISEKTQKHEKHKTQTIQMIHKWSTALERSVKTLILKKRPLWALYNMVM